MSSFSPVRRLPRFSFLLLLGGIALPGGARAQTAPASPTHSHAPAPSSHPHGVVTLDHFVTTASPFPRNQVDLAQSTTVLGGRSLLLKQQATLGETLSAETGMSATSFGAGASRPIIRGLGGDRIRLLENGVGTIDASVVSADHAVTIEPLLVERIEIIRGPASLLYGSNAVGGVVNTITHRIETDLPTERIRGGGELRFGSAADEWGRGSTLDLALLRDAARAVVLHLDGFRRSADDLRIPGFAESARLRADETAHAREHGEPPPRFARGRLPNSALDNESAAAGLSFVSPSFHAGASYSGFDSRYGVPGHAHEGEAAETGEGDAGEAEAAGVRIDLEQRRTDAQAEWHSETGFLRGARLKFGHARYHHAEIEPDGAVGTVFRNRGHDARFELLHGDGKPWSGAAGVQSTRSDFSAAGEEAFLPPSKTTSAALFAFEEIAQGPVTWQFGGRVERTRIALENGTRRRFTEPSGSFGAVWKFPPSHALAVSVGQTGRAPNAQELFADGPHAGTQAYEIGDPTLGAERSLGLEASLRRTAGAVTGAVTVFVNRFRGYVFEQPAGMLASEDSEGLPVYRYVQRDARFWGAELEAVWHLHDRDDWQLDVRVAADLTRAREGSRNLPRIPASRTSAGVLWANEAWSVGTECQWVFAQKRVASGETASAGYALASVHVSRAFAVGRTRWEAFLRGTNLADEEARPHPSFVKDLAPLAGRSATAGVRMEF